MSSEKDLNQKRQEHIIATLNFLADGGDFTKASGMMEKAKDDRVPAAKIEGHPLNTLYAENDAIKQLIDFDLLSDLKKWQQDGKNEELLARIKSSLKKLKTIKYHYKRKENSLYAFLVKYGLIEESQSTALWGMDDEVRSLVGDADEAINSEPLPDKYVIEAKIEKAATEVLRMVFIENTIFLPLLSYVSTPEDWHTVKQDELEIGYTLITYPAAWTPSKSEIDEGNWDHDRKKSLSKELLSSLDRFMKAFLKDNHPEDKVKVLKGDPSYPIGEETNSPDLVFPEIQDATLKLEIGSLSLKEIPAIFDVLPIDLTFVDKYDKVKWFSNTDRIFPRTRSVIGRPVIRCHPPKSIDKVLKILDDFHKGYADSEDFWVNVHGRTIYLCFYAVRDIDDNYLGCLETVQDISKFKDITGQKTLENRDQFKN